MYLYYLKSHSTILFRIIIFLSTKGSWPYKAATVMQQPIAQFLFFLKNRDRIDENFYCQVIETEALFVT